MAAAKQATRDDNITVRRDLRQLFILSLFDPACSTDQISVATHSPADALGDW